MRVMTSSMPLSFTDDLDGTTVSVDLVVDGELQTPAQLRAPFVRPLQLFKTEARLFAQRLHRRQAALPPLGSIFVEYRACGRVRLMLPCVAFACQRLATASADMHMSYMSWSWAEVVMERVTRGRVKKVQVRLPLSRCSGARAVLRAALVVPVLACAVTVCLTRASANTGWISGPTLRTAAAASSAPRRSFLCAGCCCRPRCRRVRLLRIGYVRRRRCGALPFDC
jgi:hypothetical protein